MNKLLAKGKQDTKWGYNKAGTVVSKDTKPWDRKTLGTPKKSKLKQISMKNSQDGDINSDGMPTNTHRGLPVNLDSLKKISGR
jgi:hypothetical protein